MLFNSYVFIYGFLPLALAGWWILPGRRIRFAFLALASWVFYGWWDWRFVPLMVASSSADYVAGRLIAASSSRRARTAYLVLLLVFNLGLLGVFKYHDFLAGTINALAGSARALPLLHAVLPIGISFYTFNSISYTIDVYRGRLAPARSFVEFTAFVAMFPHLVAGPIIRYANMASQFADLPRRPRSEEVAVGIWLLVIGMLKKVAVADPIARNLVDPLLEDPTTLRAASAWVATLGYTMQLYFDFSGYSDMAVGLAFMLGLKYPQNFDSPYKAANIAEFWRRWHMSLSFWLRDYLFIPLGGSRGTPVRTVRNLAVTTLLGGLWHGASWTFAVWGLYHGALLAVHAALRNRGWVPRSRPVSVACTFLAVVVGWVFFRARHFGDAWRILAAMAGRHGLESGTELARLAATPKLIWLPAALAVVFLARNSWELRYHRTHWAAAILAAALLACALRFETPAPFLYFRF